MGDIPGKERAVAISTRQCLKLYWGSPLCEGVAALPLMTKFGSEQEWCLVEIIWHVGIDLFLFEWYFHHPLMSKRHVRAVSGRHYLAWLDLPLPVQVVLSPLPCVLSKWQTRAVSGHHYPTCWD